MAPWRCSASAAWPIGRRSRCRVASSSAWPSPAWSPWARTCSSSTSRPGSSIPPARWRSRGMLDELASRGSAIVCAEHDPVVLGRMDRCLVLSGGRAAALAMPGAALGSPTLGPLGIEAPTIVRLAEALGVAPAQAFDEAAVAAALGARRGLELGDGWGARRARTRGHRDRGLVDGGGLGAGLGSDDPDHRGRRARPSLRRRRGGARRLAVDRARSSGSPSSGRTAPARRPWSSTSSASCGRCRVR